MTKVVHNARYGGFGLSPDAVQRGRDISRNPLWDPLVVSRDDPTLIKVVEDLGDAANGPYATLKIQELPAGSGWLVFCHDGKEWVKAKPAGYPSRVIDVSAYEEDGYPAGWDEDAEEK